MSKIKNRDFSTQLNKFFIVLVAITTVFAMSQFNISADSIFGEAPAGVDGTSLNSIMGIVWWVVRGLIALLGVIPGIVKTVHGVSDENERQRNSGIATIGIAGMAIGATFLMDDWFVVGGGD